MIDLEELEAIELAIDRLEDELGITLSVEEAGGVYAILIDMIKQTEGNT